MQPVDSSCFQQDYCYCITSYVTLLYQCIALSLQVEWAKNSLYDMVLDYNWNAIGYVTSLHCLCRWSAPKNASILHQRCTSYILSHASPTTASATALLGECPPLVAALVVAPAVAVAVAVAVAITAVGSILLPGYSVGILCHICDSFIHCFCLVGICLV